MAQKNTKVVPEMANRIKHLPEQVTAKEGKGYHPSVFQGEPGRQGSPPRASIRPFKGLWTAFKAFWDPLINLERWGEALPPLPALAFAPLARTPLLPRAEPEGRPGGPGRGIRAGVDPSWLF